MKKYSIVLLLISIFSVASSCQNKDQELVPVDNVNVTPGGGSTNQPFDPSTQTLVSQGTFKNGAHPTSGTVKLYRKGTTYTLLFDSFKTDEGPDLRIYLSEDTGARNFTELVQLNNSGNFYMTLPDDAMVDKRMFVLIWCKRFSVLFGSAELKAPSGM